MYSNSRCDVFVYRNGVLIVREEFYRDTPFDRLIGLDEGINSIQVVLQS